MTITTNTAKPPSVVDSPDETRTAGGTASNPEEIDTAGIMDSTDNSRGAGVVKAKTKTPVTGAHDTQQ